MQANVRCKFWRKTNCVLYVDMYNIVDLLGHRFNRFLLVNCLLFFWEKKIVVLLIPVLDLVKYVFSFRWQWHNKRTYVYFCRHCVRHAGMCWQACIAGNICRSQMFWCLHWPAVQICCELFLTCLNYSLSQMLNF